MSLELLLPLAMIAGFVGAMGGMGGGIILIPALTFFGVDIKHAIALSIVSVIATSSGSASAYVRDHITNLKLGMFLEVFTMTGAITGATLTLRMAPRFLFFLLSLIYCFFFERNWKYTVFTGIVFAVLTYSLLLR